MKVLLSILLLTAIIVGAYQLPISKQYIGTAIASMSFSRAVSAEQAAIVKSSTRWQLDPRMMYAVCMIESDCKNGIGAKTSSADGMYQYIRATWLSSLQKYVRATGISGIFGLTKREVLGKRHDPYLAAEVFAYDRKRREGIVKQYAQHAGLPMGALHYMDHFSFNMSKGAANKANYTRPFADIMGGAAARANGFTNRSFGSVVNLFTKKYIKFAAQTPKALLDGSGHLMIDDLAAYNTNGEYAAYQQILDTNKNKWWQPSYQAQKASTRPSQPSWLNRLLKQPAPTAPTATTTKAPVLRCSESDKKTTLQWSCPSGTTVSKGSATYGQFNTRGAGAGLVRVPVDYSLSRVTYTLQCLKSHQVLREGRCTRVSKDN